MKTLVTGLILMLSISISAQWQILNPSPQADAYTDMCAVSELEIFAVASSGNIVASTDGGSTWTLIDNIDENYINAIFFTDILTGWACGYEGALFNTEDGGETWVAQASPFGTDELTDVFFIDNQKGFISAYYGQIAMTTNGGETWTTVYEGDDNVTAIYFPTSNVGYASCENGYCYKTIDGGLNWNEIDMIVAEDFYCLWFADENTGYLGGSWGTIAKTTDGGQNWQMLTTPDNMYFYSCSFIDENTGYFSTYEGYILFTENGGNTWTVLEPGTEYSIQSIIALNEQRIVCASSNANIYISENSGINWENTAGSNIGNYNLKSICAFNNYNLIVCGSDGTVFTSNNSGYSWSESETQSMSSVNCALDLNSNSAIACGINGSIYKTTDTGNTWTSINDGQTEHLYDIAVINENTFFVAGQAGAIYKTTDGGINWSDQTVETTSWFYGIDFYGENLGLAVSHNGNIVKTTNGGDDWTNLGMVINNNLSDVKFYNSDTVFACGLGGKIIFSNDAGENWVLKNAGTNVALTKILFVEDTIYISGEYGTIIKSVDFGETWTYEETNTWRTFNDIIINDNGNLFTCGNNSTIFKYGINNVTETHPIIGENSVCIESTYSYSVEPSDYASSYNWTLPAGATGESSTNTILITYTETAISGEISVYASNEYGNAPSSELEITVNPIPNTPEITLTEYTLSSTEADTYQWYKNNNEIEGATSQTYEVIENGEYHVIITENGCFSNASNLIEVTSVNINEHSMSNSNIVIFPNPADEYITIISDEIQTNQMIVEIYNANGKLMLSNKYKQSNSEKISLSEFAKGIYFVKLIADKEILLQKLIIE
jgi:photosystem II stability/assembly factor-like uncharacterized protein